MKKNNKGFTMVELLAVIVILGVLGTIGVTATMKYLTQSRERSYRMMSQTIYEAYENCAIQGKCSLPLPGNSISNYDIKQLLDMGYLENLKNPYTSNPDCTGTIKITASSTYTSKDYLKYTYVVDLNCTGVKKTTYTWPNDKNKK